MLSGLLFNKLMDFSVLALYYSAVITGFNENLSLTMENIKNVNKTWYLVNLLFFALLLLFSRIPQKKT